MLTINKYDFNKYKDFAQEKYAVFDLVRWKNEIKFKGKKKNRGLEHLRNAPGYDRVWLNG